MCHPGNTVIQVHVEADTQDSHVRLRRRWFARRKNGRVVGWELCVGDYSSMRVIITRLGVVILPCQGVWVYDSYRNNRRLPMLY